MEMAKRVCALHVQVQVYVSRMVRLAFQENQKIQKLKVKKE